jgi:hypothetical protein
MKVDKSISLNKPVKISIFYKFPLKESLPASTNPL